MHSHSDSFDVSTATDKQCHLHSSSRPFEEAAECQLRSGSVLHLQSWCGQWPRDAATAVGIVVGFCMILLLDVGIGLLLIDCCDFVWHCWIEHHFLRVGLSWIEMD